MTHPHGAHEGTPAWRALDAALAALEATGDVELRTSRAHVLGLLCERLDEAGVGAADRPVPAAAARARMAAALEAAAAAGFDDAAWRAAAAQRHADAATEEARRQAGLVQLRLQQGSVSAEQAAEYLRRLAAGLRAGGDEGAGVGDGRGA